MAESERHEREVSRGEAEVGQHDTGVGKVTAEARRGGAGFNQPDSTAVVEVLSDIEVSLHWLFSGSMHPAKHHTNN